jgi:UDP-N-acetylglucosamine 1-carboxyvinyltransferase
MAVAMAGGDVVLENTDIALLETALETLRRAGADISSTNNGMRIKRNGAGIQPVDIVTDPFPGFPTDLQAQFMALMTRSSGISHVTETIFENRFMHVPELMRLGANVKLQGTTALVRGGARLHGAQVMATDLRASVSLVLAALVSEGETIINRVYHLDRGYEQLDRKLRLCGADIERLSV